MADGTDLPPEDVARFWAKADRSDEAGCWPWLGSRIPTGYGYWRNRPAHRWAYEMAIGPIPKGYEVDHLCRNRGCVRPNHLEAVTKRENVRRSLSPPGINAKKVRAVCGHPFDAINSNGGRECTSCRRVRHRTVALAYHRARGHLEETPERRKEWARKAGAAGAAAFMLKFTPEQRSEIGKRAAAVRQLRHGLAESCKQGHEFTPDNTYINPSSGYRSCRTCAKAREKARVRKRA